MGNTALFQTNKKITSVRLKRRKKDGKSVSTG